MDIYIIIIYIILLYILLLYIYIIMLAMTRDSNLIIAWRKFF